MKKFVKGLSEEAFRNMIISSLVQSILMLCVGVLFYFASDFVNNFIGYIIGALCIVSALNTLYKYFKRDGAKLYSLNIIFSILLLILGIVVLAKPFLVTSFLTVCTGIYLILLGCIKISYGSWFKFGSEKAWLMTFFIGLMLITFGVLLFVNPFESSHSITEVIGIFIILANLLDIADLLMIKKRSEEIVKVFW